MFAAKQFDIVSDRGAICGIGHPNVRINGIPMAALGDKVAPHACCGSPGCEIHCVAVLSMGKIRPNIRVNGQPIIIQGDVATCKEPINRQGKPSLVMVL
jgi:uncharacterized Zn-binding protein involved in type VI secretion